MYEAVSWRLVHVEVVPSATVVMWPPPMRESPVPARYPYPSITQFHRWRFIKDYSNYNNVTRTTTDTKIGKQKQSTE